MFLFILFSPEYIEYTLMGIILIPGLILASIASVRVKTAFNNYSKVMSSKEITGAECARRILDSQGLTDVTVVSSPNTELIDNYNTRTKTITLSDSVYNSTSISALGVAAHECGHAVQYAQNSKLIKLRTFIAGASTIMSSLLWPLVFIGIILDFAYIGGIVGKAFLWAGVAFYSISLLLTLSTLPVEIDASKRALKLLVNTGCLDEMEVKGSKKVLKAAAMTYVASVVVSILQLIRFVLFFLMNSRDE